MQSKMFVFIGLHDKDSNADITLLLKRLNKRFSGNHSFKFKQEKALLSAQINDVGFYLTFETSKKIEKVWIQLAKDFELSLNLNAVTEKELTERYDKSKRLLPDLYSDDDYALAKKIFDEMNRFQGIKIYSFQ